MRRVAFAATAFRLSAIIDYLGSGTTSFGQYGAAFEGTPGPRDIRLEAVVSDISSVQRRDRQQFLEQIDAALDPYGQPGFLIVRPLHRQVASLRLKMKGEVQKLRIEVSALISQ